MVPPLCRGTVRVGASPGGSNAVPAGRFGGAWAATARMPENGYTHYYRAVDHFEAGEYDLALAAADRSTALDPLMLEAYYLKAEVRETLGDRRSAIAELGRLFRAAELVDRRDTGHRETIGNAIDLLNLLRGP